MRTLSCVPAGTVTFCGTGGAAGALGAVFWDWYELPLPEVSDDGTVVRNPLSPRFSLYLRDGLDFLVFVVVARREIGAAGSGAVGVLSIVGAGVFAADATSRLLTTVFTPSIWAASLAAAVRTESLLTLPVSVTTPLLDEIVICLS